MTNTKKDCCICGIEFSDYGNNPEPLMPFDSETKVKPNRCCNDCNARFVVPARILGIGRSQPLCEIVVRLAQIGRSMIEANKAMQSPEFQALMEDKAKLADKARDMDKARGK